MNKLIVGLGNPGRSYAKTRHNLGFITLDYLAHKRGIKFKKMGDLEGELAREKQEDGTHFFFLPLTYMNLSGRAVRKAVHYCEIPNFSADAFLIVVDDIYLDFGSMRLRATGGTGGHNGLKSIEGSLQTKNYARLRMGVGPKEENIFLEDYVLGKFTEIEQNNLPAFVSKASQVLECWLDEGMDEAKKELNNINLGELGNGEEKQ